jgi:hypothetical protein
MTLIVKAKPIGGTLSFTRSIRFFPMVVSDRFLPMAVVSHRLWCRSDSIVLHARLRTQSRLFLEEQLMNRRRLMFIGAVALALGGLLSSAVYRQLQKNMVAGQPPQVDVLIAANNIPAGKQIEDRDLKVVSYRRFLAFRCPAHEKERGGPRSGPSH